MCDWAKDGVPAHKCELDEKEEVCDWAKDGVPTHQIPKCWMKKKLGSTHGKKKKKKKK